MAKKTSGTINQASGQNWQMYHGDCVEVMQSLPDNTIDFCIHSPPFSSLYIYSDSENDMGNSASDAEFFEHYAFAIKEIERLLVPGRLCAVHCKDLPKYANVYGTTGLIDFPGACIAEFEAAGLVYHSRVTVWKCPVVERERTNNNGLLHKTVKRDTTQVRQGMADYLLLFRKPPSEGDGLMSAKPVRRETGFARYIGQAGSSNAEHPSPYCRKSSSDDPSIDIWRRYAEPVWWDVDQTNVLNFQIARDDRDERHICPLQLDLIERAVEIWTNPGDVVLSPFGGVGSEGVGAMRVGRKFIGVELKESYYNHALNELARCETIMNQPSLLDLITDDEDATAAFAPGET